MLIISLLLLANFSLCLGRQCVYHYADQTELRQPAAAVADAAAVVADAAAVATTASAAAAARCCYWALVAHADAATAVLHDTRLASLYPHAHQQHCSLLRCGG